MARADRLERLDRERIALEQDYAATLIAALRKCAGGSWGLFGHNQNRHERANWSAVLTELDEMGAQIGTMRETLSLPPFDLHQEFEAARGPVAATAPGEPKQAKAWLDKLDQAP
jgi:hypothetical protein